MSVNFRNQEKQNNGHANINQNQYWLWEKRDENLLIDKYDFRNRIQSQLAPEAQDESVRVLNELIEANYERILEYDLASRELNDGDADLKIFFAMMIADSHDYILETVREIESLGGVAAKGSPNNGKIYHRWTGFRRNTTEHDRRAILACCATGEAMVQKAYTEAFAEDKITITARALISGQAGLLSMSMNKVAALSKMLAA